ncbi:serine protease persephone [Anoplophora glabripennis]|uniref:serine protease persephone n=1 Tax=Anoplophora glabripennis TaxID=217634 RepID=UPI0008740D9A|nr:serine protease persephone [Anoplophora glabripennis]
MVVPLNFSVVACLFVLVHCAASLYEGDSCTLKNGNGGTCKYLTHCPAALQLLQSGVFPEICGFEGTQSIICCEGAAGGKKTTSTTTTTTKAPTRRTTTHEPEVTSKVTVTNRTPGEVSKQKCKEYAQYAYDRSQSPTLSIIPHFGNTLECAFEKLQLIVGGTLATRQEFPHMALIGYKTGDEIVWACGGSLISENFVLTAGHCLKNHQLGSAALIRVGLTNQSDHAHMQERTVNEVIAYPEYSFSKYHDIGLLRLSKKVNLDIYARPACLQTQKNIPFKKAIASGWGRVEYSGEGSNDLLKVVLEFFSLDKCNATYRRDIIAPNSNLKNGIIDDLMVCAGSSKELKDTCQGDSGGPLQVYHDESQGVKCMYDIVGVTSFGKSCGLAKNIPGVYTRVSAYIKWIEDTVWPN